MRNVTSKVAKKLVGEMLYRLEPVAAELFMEHAIENGFADEEKMREDFYEVMVLSTTISAKRQADAMKEIARFFRKVTSVQSQTGSGGSTQQKQLAPPTTPYPKNWDLYETKANEGPFNGR
jgi:hypothetical protein